MKRLFVMMLCLMLVLCLVGCGRKSDPTGEVKVAEEDTVEEQAELNAITYCDGSVTARFVLDETGSWSWVDNTEFPLSEEKMEELNEYLSRLKALSPVVPQEELSVYGLETPTRYLAVSYSNNNREIFYFGKQNEAGSWYVRTEDPEKMYIAPEDMGAMLSRSVYDMMRLPELPVLTEENLRSVTFKHGEEGIVLTWKDGQWKKGSYEATADMIEAAEAVKDLRLAKCVDYTPAEGAWEVCGLTEPQVTVIVNYVNTVGVDSKETFLVGAFRESERGYYVAVNEDSTIYLMPAEVLEKILALTF